MKNRTPDLRKLVLAALFAALITLFTLFIRIPIPNTGGYVHPGDCLIYLISWLLPGWYAVAASAIGGFLSDLCTGSVVYLLPTVLIKAGMSALASLFFRRGKSLARNLILPLTFGALLLTGGYFLFEAVVFGLAYAVSGVLWNLTQGLMGGILGAMLIGAFGFLRGRFF